MKEQVNHPKHYNSHPAGIECIDIIRHYTCDIANAIKYLWRAGLKPEMGKDDADKEIEDLKKALWYIEDYSQHMPKTKKFPVPHGSVFFKEVVGYWPDDVIAPYCEDIKWALNCLFYLGIVKKGVVYSIDDYHYYMKTAVERIQQHILDIEWQLTNKELQSTVDVMNGYAVEGEDYVAKPGGVRETEPDKYDPLNIIIIQGTAYCLTDDVRKKSNGALYGPCDNCALSEYCVSNDGTESLKNLCNLHYATDQQYYREVGTAKYAPSFGTIEVVDELKEMQIAARELEDEE